MKFKRFSSMYQCKEHYVYIMTNKNRTVLYIGVTSELGERVHKHFCGLWNGFAKKYNCHYLIYYEKFEYISDAIKREKQLKGWRREKKLTLITTKNPQLKFLNDEIQSL
ncbi:MAG: GIY-YIG nuclease family protein [Candidatus Cloacimonadota bacterium]|nr:GIY-YIG nuclease family protein [Candidatus Cloacimonadota bacterium]